MFRCPWCEGDRFMVGTYLLCANLSCDWQSEQEMPARITTWKGMPADWGAWRDSAV